VFIAHPFTVGKVAPALGACGLFVVPNALMHGLGQLDGECQQVVNAPCGSGGTFNVITQGDIFGPGLCRCQQGCQVVKGITQGHTFTH
jgi:hypothetical protein